MKKRTILELSAGIALSLLTVMGLYFVWYCPDRVGATDAHGAFRDHLIWCVIGIVAFFGVIRLGWRRCIKPAPWLVALWLTSFAAAKLGLLQHCSHRKVLIAGAHINVVTLFMPICALFVTWAHEKFRVRRWIEWMVLGIALVGIVFVVVTNPYLMERISAHLNPDAHSMDYTYMSRQLQMAWTSAHWFGNSGGNLTSLPCADSDGMLSASALLFGRWFPLTIVALFSFLGWILSSVAINAPKTSIRRYALIFGMWLIVPAAYNFLHSQGVLPVAGKSPAVAAVGRSAAAAAWFGAGMIVSMIRDGADKADSDFSVRRMWYAFWVWSSLFFMGAK